MATRQDDLYTTREVTQQDVERALQRALEKLGSSGAGTKKQGQKS